ncbi:PDDEXK nuclease domain-containing protein [Dyadobacter frigoris]|uniref:PDDEXK nuclease domain-containing protein n=1 Tax=Dyadobacter frigoris TaxID=2576211 RepID=UPI0035B64E15
MLICKDKNKVVTEYALKDINKPIGISEYKSQIASRKILKENCQVSKNLKLSKG